MTETDATLWYRSAPKEATAFVRATAAAYLAQRGAIAEPMRYADAARDAFAMACALAVRFWPIDQDMRP